MKRDLLFLFMFLPLVVISQTCEEKIAIAKKTKDGGDYRLALKQFNAAAADCGSAKSAEIEKQILEIYDKIEGLRNDALKAKTRAETAEKNSLAEKEKALAAEAETKRAFQKADKLINAFYFYSDRFALAFKNNQFYFIDKNGDPVSKLGRYDKSDQFDYITGFAKVITQGEDFLLDTLRNNYHLVYALADLNPNATALDLRGKQLESFPNEIFQHTQLKVLILNNGYFEKQRLTLPRAIKGLGNLQVIHLTHCHLDSLPVEIGVLKNLQSLTVLGNQLTSIPAELVNLLKLQDLDLGSNQLTSIPVEFGKLQKLQYLDLGSNQLTSIPTEFGKLQKLKELRLYENQITEVPAELGKLQNLQFLHLSGNKLTKIPPELSKLQNLQWLRNGVKITFQFQANYFGVSQLSFEANSGAI